MSHRWCYHCKTCSEYGPNLNRGLECLSELWSIWPAMCRAKQAFGKQDSKEVSVELQFEISPYSSDSRELIDFLNEHGDHVVEISSEYASVASHELPQHESPGM